MIRTSVKVLWAFKVIYFHRILYVCYRDDAEWDEEQEEEAKRLVMENSSELVADDLKGIKRDFALDIYKYM